MAMSWVRIPAHGGVLLPWMSRKHTRRRIPFPEYARARSKTNRKGEHSILKTQPVRRKLAQPDKILAHKSPPRPAPPALDGQKKAWNLCAFLKQRRATERKQLLSARTDYEIGSIQKQEDRKLPMHLLSVAVPRLPAP